MTKYLADDLVEAQTQLQKEKSSSSKAETETYFKVCGFQKFKTEAEWNEFNQGMNESANREPVYNDSISRYNAKVLNQWLRKETVKEEKKKNVEFMNSDPFMDDEEPKIVHISKPKVIKKVIKKP